MLAPLPPLIIEDDMFVRARASVVNNNNIQTRSPFQCTELDGSQLKTIEKVEGAICDDCGLLFSTFSQLCAHQAKKPCPTPPPSGHNVRIKFKNILFATKIIVRFE